MRLSCLQENLSRGLNIIGRAVATRTTLPITQNVLLSADRSQLKLSATNLEIAISTWIGAKIEEEGAITVPARLLTEFVGSLSQDRIDMSLSESSTSLHVSSGRFVANVNGAKAEDFPPIPSVEEGVAARVDPQSLRAAINQVAFATASEDSRPVLTGVKVEIDGSKATFAAADGFRLAVHHADLLEPVVESVAVIVPGRTLREINQLISLSSTEEPVEIMVTPQKSQIMFRLKNIEVVSQLIQGSFPNYGQLIPDGYTARTVVNLQEFQRATKSTSIFARDGSGIIRLQMTPGESGIGGQLLVSARGEELGENEGTLEASVEGEEGKIAFNSKYLAEALAVIDKSEVALEITNSSSPGVLKPVGSDNYVHVVMPMFVQW
jgi:DNA polymerase-3 subunit beta